MASRHKIEFAVAVALAIAACAPAPSGNLFEQAETHIRDQEYAAAIPLLKQLLLHDPDHAGAHFYLGRCYLYSTDEKWLGVAQGELETALALFVRQGRVNPIPRFSDAHYFEIICHIELAKVLIQLAYTVAETPQLQMRGISKGVVIGRILAKLDEQYESVRALDADHPDVVWLKQQIAGMNGIYRHAVKPARQIKLSI